MSKPQLDPSDKVKFHTALSNLLTSVNAMKKDEKNPFFKSSYIPLPKMLEAVKPVATQCGFILTQPVELVNSQTGIVNVVSSRLVHIETGIAEVSQMALPPIDDLQKLGGAITYARRYTLSALLALEERDDDGNAASGKVVPKRKISKSDDF